MSLLSDSTLFFCLLIKRERQVGRLGVSRNWTVHIVLFTCEILVNGTPPSAVPTNILTVSAALTGTEACELPSISLFENSESSCRL